MSAFLCDIQTFAHLAQFANRQENQRFYNTAKKCFIGLSSVSDIAEELAIENIRSVETRYPSNGPAGGFLVDIYDAKEPVIDFLSQVRKKANQHDKMHHFATINDLAETYNYQACEHPDYYDSNAYHLIQHIFNDVRHCAVDDFNQKKRIAP